MAILIINKFPKYINLAASSVKSILSEFLTWGQSIPARFWGTETPEYWGGLDAQAEAHYNRVIADGGVVPAGLGGVNSFFQVVKNIYATADITTAISAAYDAHYLGYKLGAGSGTTLGQAAQKLYSCSGASADVTQTTAASQPLLLAHTGENYWWGSGVAANLNTSNLQSAFNFGGDFSMVFDIKPLPTTSMEISGCLNSIFYSFAVMSTGVLRFNGGGQTISSTSGINTTIRQWVRISRSGNNWLFYTSLDGTTWTQLGTTVVNSVSLSGTSINIRVGDGAGGIASLFNGSIFRGLFYTDSTLTTLRADFNPASYNAATSQTQWTSATGEVWTINTGTATTGYKGVLVDRTIAQGDGTDDGLKLTSLAAFNTKTMTLYAASKSLSNTDGVLVELSNDWNSNNKTFLHTSGVIKAAAFGIKGNNFNIYTAPGNVNLRLYSSRADSSLTPATAEIDLYYNNSLQVKTTISSSDDNFTFDTVYPLNIFGRNGGASACSNSILNTLIIKSGYDDTAKLTAVYNYIKTINNNAF